MSGTIHLVKKLTKTNKDIKVYQITSCPEKFLENREHFRIEEKFLGMDDCQGGVSVLDDKNFQAEKIIDPLFTSEKHEDLGVLISPNPVSIR